MTKDEATQMIKEAERSGGFVYPQADPWNELKGGITRRDDLAKAAMQSLIQIDRMEQDSIVKCSYEFADAMIAEGRKE